MRLLVRWLISAVSLMIVEYFVPGFVVRGFLSALLAAVVIGFINSTFGFVLKIVTLPLTFLTFGLFLIVINAFLIKIAAAVTPGFDVQTWQAAFIGSILFSIVSWLLHWLIGDKKREREY
ncbi:MAG TPA: phage holin family protein [Candidatus Angelobacter sp.]|jgi:putative membrane protein|nr:phage holin family protein [Candidatus Angelobacter sp.]